MTDKNNAIEKRLSQIMKEEGFSLWMIPLVEKLEAQSVAAQKEREDVCSEVAAYLQKFLKEEQTLDGLQSTIESYAEGLSGELVPLIAHSEDMQHDVMAEELYRTKFSVDCGNVPFLHCEDGCDCKDCQGCGA